MQSTVQKWGNSLAVRIPKSLAEEAHLQQGADVHIRVEAGEIRIKPAVPRYALEELLDQITGENLHAEISTGESVGNEAW